MINYKIYESIESEMESLKKIIEDEFCVEDLVTTSRTRKNVNARMIYSKILKDRGHTYSSIGKSIRKDHATIIHYVCNAELFIRYEADLRERYIRSRSMFLENREPMFKNPTQRDLLNKIAALNNQIEIYEIEKQKLVEKQRKLDRLNSIMQLLSDNLPNGHEHNVEIKIRRILNNINK
jgi:hypothetical protein